ncbi:hypothetical protein [Bacillus sp. P14.5]|uniref:hypothetical protein n=1 Tax=Bacillus sp. P14.5 TaxID=1983400 RepID=UPI000DE85FFE|nr:hypothetical protein [Bacillus sp. P14.5]
MFYNAKTHRTLLLFLLVFAIWALFLNRDYPHMYYFLIPYFIFVLTANFSQFKLLIEKDTLSFQMIIFELNVYRKEIKSNQIAVMKFKRVGWGRKCVVAQTKKGLNLRLVNFYPEKIFMT